MPTPVEFYFDFASPYGYFAAQKIDRMCEERGRDVVWKPILIGVAMKMNGTPPPVAVPLKGDYYRMDFERLARYQGLPWQMPDPFPIATQAAARAFYWIDDQDPAKAKAYAWDCYTAFFGEGEKINEPDVVAAIAARQGFDEAAVLAALDDDTVKQRLKDETNAAIEKGVFGSPFFIVDGEKFWGADRLWMVRTWLKNGTWDVERNDK